MRENLRSAIKSMNNQPDPTALYNIIGAAVAGQIRPQWEKDLSYSGKTAHYLSMEFLIGRTLHSNLANLGCLEEVLQLLQENGINSSLLEEHPDAALGNGGLGRLAACFLESAATLQIPLNGYGIRYRYGLFKQQFSAGNQVELPDDWLISGDPFSIRRDDLQKTIRFGNAKVTAVPYDMPVIGYRSSRIGLLRLWQAEGELAYISDYLYPDDSTPEGKALRLQQEYFFSAATVQDVVESYLNRYGGDFSLFPEYHIFQLNDTHPVVAILEFIRILTEQHQLPFQEALALARKSFAYTNHTVMQEALERWGLKLFNKVLPQLTKVAEELHRVSLAEYREKLSPAAVEKVRFITGQEINIAKLALYVCDRVNGVARIHTQIIKNSLFKEFHQLYPHKIRSVTNGVTQRRWLLLANPRLARLITSLIGEGWITDLQELSKLNPYLEDDRVLDELFAIKEHNKAVLRDYIKAHEGMEIDSSFIFDLQIKRIHEYKRQLMNALSLLYIYYGIKEGTIRNFHPTVFIFGGKGAGSYYRAKAIIKLINEIATLVNNDPACSSLLKVVFVQNYGVSYAEKLIPAADVSEQISLAGTEASGTGNMKLALNGAVTLGTLDGANIEIVNYAGAANNYIFGLQEAEVRKVKETYDSVKFLSSRPDLQRLVNTLIDGTFSATPQLKDIYHALTAENDSYLVLRELDSYLEAKLKVNTDYRNSREFSQKALSNISSAGYFSSDRAIKEYAHHIWQL